MIAAPRQPPGRITGYIPSLTKNPWGHGTYAPRATSGSSGRIAEIVPEAGGTGLAAPLRTVTNCVANADAGY